MFLEKDEEMRGNVAYMSSVMAVHMFNKQNKISLSEIWNSYHNGQSVTALNLSLAVTALTVTILHLVPILKHRCIIR